MNNGPAIDPSDMSDNQSTLLHSPPFNVQKDWDDTTNSVNDGVPINVVDTSVNQGFVDAAPNLPFKLPFGLDKIFHRRKR